MFSGDAVVLASMIVHRVALISCAVSATSVDRISIAGIIRKEYYIL